MISCINNVCYKTKCNFSEAWASDSHHCANTLFSLVPVLGLVGICNTEYSLSIKLLSAIEEEDVQESITLVNRKNCQKLYLAIHIFVLKAFAILIVGPLIPLLIMIAGLAKTIFDINRSHKMIDKIRKSKISFNNVKDKFPRMRYERLSWLVPWVECSLWNSKKQKVEFLTVY